MYPETLCSLFTYMPPYHLHGRCLHSSLIIIYFLLTMPKVQQLQISQNQLHISRDTFLNMMDEFALLVVTYDFLASQLPSPIHILISVCYTNYITLSVTCALRIFYNGWPRLMQYRYAGDIQGAPIMTTYQKDILKFDDMVRILASGNWFNS